MDVTVTITTIDGRTVVEVSGEIDIYSAPTLRERLVDLIDHGHSDLVVDLTKVRYMDSSGLGLLIGALKRVRGVGGQLHLVVASPALLQVFQITALTQVFTIFPTRAEALAHAHED